MSAAATVAALAAAAPASSSTDSLAPTTSLEGDASTDSTRLSKRMQLSHDQRAVLEAVVSAPPASSAPCPHPHAHHRPTAPSTFRSQFVNERTPDAQLRVDLGAYLQLTPRRVQVWFQNRRQREKSANPGDAAPAGAASVHQPAALPGRLDYGARHAGAARRRRARRREQPGAPPAVEPAALATAASAEEDLVPGADESDDAEYEAQPDDDE